MTQYVLAYRLYVNEEAPCRPARGGGFFFFFFFRLTARSKRRSVVSRRRGCLGGGRTFDRLRDTSCTRILAAVGDTDRNAARCIGCRMRARCVNLDTLRGGSRWQQRRDRGGGGLRGNYRRNRQGEKDRIGAACDGQAAGSGGSRALLSRRHRACGTNSHRKNPKALAVPHAQSVPCAGLRARVLTATASCDPWFHAATPPEPSG